MIEGWNWWRANEIVMRHLTRRLETRYRCRDKAVGQGGELLKLPVCRRLQRVRGLCEHMGGVRSVSRRRLHSVDALSDHEPRRATRAHGGDHAREIIAERH